jgi:putative inorganic carbon (HCO3(-)) transporter
MVPVTFYATTDLQTTFVQISRLLAGLALMYGIINWVQSKSHVLVLVMGLTGVGLGLALVAPVTVGWFSQVKSFLIPARVYEILPTLVNDTIHPNIMAGALVMLMPFPLALLLLSPEDSQPVTEGVPKLVTQVLNKHWLRNLWYKTATLLMLGMLLLTKSRAGWLAAVVAILVVLVRRWRFFLWSVPIGAICVGVLIWVVGLPQFLDWISTGGLVSGWDGRVEIWSRALYMIQDFPFTGIGAGTFQPVANVLYPFFLAGPNAEIPHAHNLLLQVAVDLGIPGLIAFVAILFLTFWSTLYSVRFYTRAGDKTMAAVSWAGLSSLMGMLVHDTMHSSTWIVARTAFIPWLVMGLAVALYLEAKRMPSDE